MILSTKLMEIGGQNYRHHHVVLQEKIKDHQKAHTFSSGGPVPGAE
jgi:hypothetical protein